MKLVCFSCSFRENISICYMHIHLPCMYHSSTGTSSTSFKLQARAMVLSSRLYPVINNNKRKLKSAKMLEGKLKYCLHFVWHLYHRFYQHSSDKFIIILPALLHGCETWSITLREEQILKLKSATFWDITPCSPLKINRRFRGTYCLHLQGRRISQARNQGKSSARKTAFMPDFARLILRP
jgi:hypothetical protein